MGLVETFLGHVSAKSVVAFIVCALVVRFIFQRIDERIRVRRLGRPGRQVTSYVPWGELPFRNCACANSDMSDQTN